MVLSRERLGNRAAKLQIYVYARFGGGRRRDRREREEKRTEAEVNKTKVGEGTVDRWRDGKQPGDGTWLRVCDDGSFSRKRRVCEKRESSCAGWLRTKAWLELFLIASLLHLLSFDLPALAGDTFHVAPLSLLLSLLFPFFSSILNRLGFIGVSLDLPPRTRGRIVVHETRLVLRILDREENSPSSVRRGVDDDA